MDLSIRGQQQRFQSVKNFRASYNLPDDFGIETFQPKDYSDLGSIDHAHSDLAAVHKTILAAVPAQRPSEGWLAWSITLQLLFQKQLREINPHIGLKNSEITYAVAGFGDICQVMIHEISKASMMGRDLPLFTQMYSRWLNSTVEVSDRHHTYPYQDEVWNIYIIRHRFGRIGLMIEMAAGTQYVYDGHLICPAEGFMYSLMRDIANALLCSHQRERMG